MALESQGKGKVLSVDSRPIRPVGDSIGFTLDKRALRELGLVDDDGDLVDDVNARQFIYDSGEVEIEIDLEDVNERIGIVAD